ncbi:outer membrane beta-barrel protein [Massilia sp. TWP1-3-3]|uniref:outer membrane beta-barrel protein n=1 Tax=Massilia sp. TWP1-3-3 TaxID=2804573 RepID=UPI003CF79BB7
MFKKIIIASALTLLASTSFAQSAATPHVYAGVDVGSVDVDGYDKETSAGVFAGYSFNENWAIEGGYRQAKFDLFKVKQTHLSVVGTLPLSNGFNIFGRVGYNDINAKRNVTGGSLTADLDSGALYGVGVGYAFTPMITGRVEYQRPVSDANIVTAAVLFAF